MTHGGKIVITSVTFIICSLFVSMSVLVVTDGKWCPYVPHEMHDGISGSCHEVNGTMNFTRGEIAYHTANPNKIYGADDCNNVIAEQINDTHACILLHDARTFVILDMRCDSSDCNKQRSFATLFPVVSYSLSILMPIVVGSVTYCILNKKTKRFPHTSYGTISP